MLCLPFPLVIITVIFSDRIVGMERLTVAGRRGFDLAGIAHRLDKFVNSIGKGAPPLFVGSIRYKGGEDSDFCGGAVIKMRDDEGDSNVLVTTYGCGDSIDDAYVGAEVIFPDNHVVTIIKGSVKKVKGLGLATALLSHPVAEIYSIFVSRSPQLSSPSSGTAAWRSDAAAGQVMKVPVSVVDPQRCRGDNRFHSHIMLCVVDGTSTIDAFVKEGSLYYSSNGEDGKPVLRGLYYKKISTGLLAFIN